MEHRNGIQQCSVFVSVLADFYDMLLSGSPEDEKFRPPYREPVFLCVGRTGLCDADAFFYGI